MSIFSVRVRLGLAVAAVTRNVEKCASGSR